MQCSTFGTRRFPIAINSPRLSPSLLPLCGYDAGGAGEVFPNARMADTSALLGPSLAALSFCSSTLGALGLLTLAGVLNASAPVDVRFQCALSAASCTTTCIFYWRLAGARRQPLMQGYTDAANASLESQRYLGWVLNVALLTMIGVSLHGESGTAVLVGATFGALSMVCSGTGWSTLGESARRIAHRSKGGFGLLLLGVLLLVGSAAAATALERQLAVENTEEYRLSYGELRSTLLWWVRVSCLSYPLFSVVAMAWSVAAVCSRIGHEDHDEDADGRCDGCDGCDGCANCLACVLGTIFQSRRVGGAGSTHYSPVALVDEMCLHQLNGKHVNLTWPSRGAMQQYQILDTLGCIIDLFVVGGTAVGCALYAFSWL